MAQSGFTPIKLYLSTTPAAVPTAANLEPGELALNNADGKLFYEDSAGVVQVIATKAGASGTVTSVGGTGTVNGISLSGTVTSSGNLTLGGALTGVNLGTQVTGTLPVANGGTGQTSYTNGQLLIGNTTGNTLAKANLTAGSGVTITNGAGSITIAATGSGGTVTSVGGTGTVNGISLSGTVTSSGNLTLGGTLSGVNLTTQVTGTLPVANGGTGAATLSGVVIGNGTSAFTVKTNPTGAFVGTTDTQTLTNKTLTDPAMIGTIIEDVFTITDGAAFEINPGNGSIQLITLGASRTPKATNFIAGEAITLMVDDGSAFTLTWTDATFGGSGVIWETDGGSAPTLSTSGYTTIVLWKVSTQVYGARVGNA